MVMNQKTFSILVLIFAFSFFIIIYGAWYPNYVSKNPLLIKGLNITSNYTGKIKIPQCQSYTVPPCYFKNSNDSYYIKDLATFDKSKYGHNNFTAHYTIDGKDIILEFDGNYIYINNTRFYFCTYKKVIYPRGNP